MAITQRRDRDRARRHQAIIAAARELAEAEGWDAVTTRRLADRVEYSQPVLYSHFQNRDAIVQAVAIEGFAELTAALDQARLSSPLPREALRALCRAYEDFAAERPALYRAMFVLPTAVRFADPTATPPPLQAAFAAFVAVLKPYAMQPELAAEVVWAALHGLVVLGGSGRIPATGRQARLELLVDQVAGRETASDPEAAKP